MSKFDVSYNINGNGTMKNVKVFYIRNDQTSEIKLKYEERILYMLSIKNISRPFTFKASDWTSWKIVGIKLSNEAICVVFHFVVES